MAQPRASRPQRVVTPMSKLEASFYTPRPRSANDSRWTLNQSRRLSCFVDPDITVPALQRAASCSSIISALTDAVTSDVGSKEREDFPLGDECYRQVPASGIEGSIPGLASQVTGFLPGSHVTLVYRHAVKEVSSWASKREYSSSYGVPFYLSAASFPTLFSPSSCPLDGVRRALLAPGCLEPQSGGFDGIKWGSPQAMTATSVCRAFLEWTGSHNVFSRHDDMERQHQQTGHRNHILLPAVTVSTLPLS
ncbi:hypothetical protein Cob_v011340 [Colletotrichum orbiculare MAFF 240422]|uniref:Uncharacterized protein n=1 Tax=Colletotrichum orbiculare (strain 104-T / ATCC 96160 / CBS 514.97 / LARS 414 / MAFF 240422) TaxID=1213857 RepID=A0A484FCB6_COLOR|nr:hypothetical protein Cob_v011340 [Colletotrichum orbiculare MAFF 240422]